MTVPTRHNHVPANSQCVDIGPAECIRPWPDADGRVRSYFIAHDWPDSDTGPHASGRCEGRVPVNRANEHPSWTATGSLDGGDLTLSPSVLCVEHNWHGFLRNGKWQPV